MDAATSSRPPGPFRPEDSQHWSIRSPKLVHVRQPIGVVGDYSVYAALLGIDYFFGLVGCVGEDLKARLV